MCPRPPWPPGFWPRFWFGQSNLSKHGESNNGERKTALATRIENLNWDVAKPSAHFETINMEIWPIRQVVLDGNISISVQNIRNEPAYRGNITAGRILNGNDDVQSGWSKVLLQEKVVGVLKNKNDFSPVQCIASAIAILSLLHWYRHALGDWNTVPWLIHAWTHSCFDLVVWDPSCHMLLRVP